MAAAATTAMDARHGWFRELNAEQRSWITLVVRKGIDGFVDWFANDANNPFSAPEIFQVAPRKLTTQISLHQTVELVRTTIEVTENQIDSLLPRSDRQILKTAIVHYSREVAFAAAEAYAKAAEMRGSWDARLEAMLVDAIIRADAKETVDSRASTLGWRTENNVVVVIGPVPNESAEIAKLRQSAESLDLDLFAAVQGNRLVVVIGSPSITGKDAAIEKISQLEKYFNLGPIVLGSVVSDLEQAYLSASEANNGYRVARSWPEGPRILLADDLLPERVLIGDLDAREILVSQVYRTLDDAGGDLLATCVAFLDQGTSIEATARQLFVHPNTVRYRTKRIEEVTGYSPTEPRGAYILRLAITLGRLNKIDNLP
ncbi:MAG: PucR family transcriptional regulator [Propionibacterium sp.]|nr:MAG: PucR family transcriptional regulator [Propionibacterium sp.]